MNANILLPGDGPVKSQRRCPACHDRLLIGRAKMDGKLICHNDGYTVDADPEETRPKGGLVSVETERGMLVQPSKNVDELEDLPAGAHLVREIDVLNGAETSPKRRISQREAADIVIFR